YNGQTLDYYEIAYGYLSYRPDPYASSSYNDSFSFTANDGKDNSSPAMVTFNVTVIPSSPPTVTGSSHSLNAIQTHSLTLADLGYSHAGGDPLQSITLQSLPSTLSLHDALPILYNGQTLDYYEIAYGYLSYRPDPYASSSYNDSFSFT